VHAGSENHCETTKSLKICYLFNINRERVYHTKISGHRWTETTHHHSESHGYWMCCWRVVQCQHVYVRAGGVHFEHTL